MEKKKSVLILTSGGDAPGMNACLFYLSKILEENNFDTLFAVGGFDGLINNNITKLCSNDFKFSLSEGGSKIKAGRSEAFRTKAGMEKAVVNFNKSKAECLIAIGGNGTLAGLTDLGGKIPCIHIPATIDNDVFYSEYSLGFDSSANENIRMIRNIKAACFSQGKIAIVEIMGRECSKLAFNCAIGVAADVCITRECPITEEAIIKTIAAKIKQGKQDIVIVAIEKYIDLNKLSEKIIDKFKIDTRVFVNGYAQRGADASAFDISLALKFATVAVSSVLQNQYFKAVGIKNDQSFKIDLQNAINNENNFDKNAYKMLYK